MLKNLLAIFCLLAGNIQLSAATTQTDRPNLLIIHTDEHNFRTLGCYRELLPKEATTVWGKDALLATPNIDSLAREGAVAIRFYAASPVCTPSRASFVSGRYSQNTGSYKNDLPMRDDVVTFAEVLRKNGYATGYAGKWHLDGPAKPGFGPARKFGFEDNRYMFNRGHWKQLTDTLKGPAVKAVDPKGNPTYSADGADEKSFTTDFLADKTIAFIREHRDQPFCFMVSIPDPHGPNTVRPPYDKQFSSVNFQRPASATEPGKDLPTWAEARGNPQMEPMDRYFGMVKCIDDNVGNILGALRKNNLLDRTIVVFTSDHGDLCGEHGRVNKGNPLETSACIPFVIRYPAKIKPGSVVREAFSNADFKPTILGIMGVPNPSRDEGRDGSAIFLTGQASPRWQDVAFSRNSGGNWLMAISSRYKLVFSVTDNPCLFDLEKDPLEMTNLFPQPAARETSRTLAKALVQYARQYGEPATNNAALNADLLWTAQGTGTYTAPKRIPGAAAKDEDEETQPGTKANAKKGKRKNK